MNRQEQEKNERSLLAWGVHLLTASGIVLALLALDALIRERASEAFLWLFVALVVDGVDGSLARAVKVKERLPRIDGEALDLIIDYVTYVLIPAILIWRMDILPASTGLPLAALILLSSLYVFARRDMKTDDGYFRGFPALWNIVAFYFFVAPPTPAVGAAVVVMLAALTFAPIHVMHPFRARHFGRWPPLIAILWCLCTAALLAPPVTGGLRTALLTASLATAAVLIAMGLWRTFRPPETAAPATG